MQVLVEFVKGDRWFFGWQQTPRVDTGIQLIFFRTYCIFETETIVVSEMIVKILRLKLWSHNKIWKQTAASGITTSNLFTVSRRHVHCRCSFWDVPPFPWKPGLPNVTVQALGSFCNHCSEQCVAFLKVCRCKRKDFTWTFLQEADLRVIVNKLMHGYARLHGSSFSRACVFLIVQFLQGVLLKNNMTVIISMCIFCNFGHHLTYPAFLNLSFAARKPRLRILLKRLAEAPDPLAFLLWYLGPWLFVNWQQLLISWVKDLNPSMSSRAWPVTEANESRSLRISAQL